MNPVLLEAGAIIAVAVAFLLAVTTLALRRSDGHRPGRAGTGRGSDRTAPDRHVGGGGGAVASSILAALPTWAGVLATLLLLVRGKVALAAVVALGTLVHAGILRFRAARGRSAP